MVLYPIYEHLKIFYDGAALPSPILPRENMIKVYVLRKGMVDRANKKYVKTHFNRAFVGPVTRTQICTCLGTIAITVAITNAIALAITIGIAILHLFVGTNITRLMARVITTAITIATAYAIVFVIPIGNIIAYFTVGTNITMASAIH